LEEYYIHCSLCTLY